ncbi:MAG: hypothetical protein CR960_02555, partial [Pasteurellales bacterium]
GDGVNEAFKVHVATLDSLDNSKDAPVSSTAVNTAIDKVKNMPITFEDDDGTSTKRKLGSTFKIKGGNASDTSNTNTDMGDGDSVVNVDALNAVKTELGNNITQNTTAIGKLEKQKISLTGDDGETSPQSLEREEALKFAIEGKDGGAIKTEAVAGTNKVEVEVLVDNTTIEINGDNKLQAKTDGFDKNADGTVDAQSPNSLATAGNIADAIKNSGFVVKASKN